MKSMKLPKSPVKTSIARHDEHPDDHTIDSACPICQVDIGTKSPDGVKEGWAVTPCGHVFGNVCIKRYLAITDRPLCPVCRTDLFHACAHPILPASYDPKKSQLARDEAAAKAFPGEPQHSDCRFCRHQKVKAARRARVQEMLEGGSPGRPSGSSDAEDSDGGDAAAAAAAAAAATGSGRLKGWRLALHITTTLARLTLDAARIRKIKALHPEEEDGDMRTEGIIVADSPQLPATPGRDLPPVPGPYGHWELANRVPDWKFLAWFDSQEPKTKTTADQFS